MHKLLTRQLRRFFGSETPDTDEWASFLSAVDEAYRQADDDRELLEHSMDTVSGEFVVRYERLQKALAESRRAEEELRSALSLVEATLDATADGILVVDNQGGIVRTNDRFIQQWNIPEAMLVSGESERALDWVLDQLEDPERFLARLREVIADRDAESFDTIRFKNGLVLERYSKPQKIEGATVGRVWSFRDISKRRELEEQLRHAQKLQAVGTLAGGIAHDFNNLITVIQVHAAEIRKDAAVTGESLESAAEISQAAARAAELTGQLLAFSRKQVLRPVVLDLNQIVRGVEPLLRRLIGEDIDLRIRLTNEIGAVEADPGQLGQVIINLAVNARDAMPYGGWLLITTAEIIHVSTGADAMASGRYVVLTVSDSGHGVPPKDRDRIFDPFFTTKEFGKGTGLGLATAYGIVAQSGGHIRLEDKLPDSDHAVGTIVEGEMEWRGATFCVYLPQTENLPTSDLRKPIEARSVGGTETILLRRTMTPFGASLNACWSVAATWSCPPKAVRMQTGWPWNTRAPSISC